MNPPKAQEGLWPDGSSGAKEIYLCPSCGDELSVYDIDPLYFSDVGAPRDERTGNYVCEECECDYESYPVVPASLAAELAEALEECIQLATEGWGYASPYFGEKWQCEKDIAKAQAALDSYRARMGEGK